MVAKNARATLKRMKSQLATKITSCEALSFKTNAPKDRQGQLNRRAHFGINHLPNVVLGAVPSAPSFGDCDER